MKSTEQSIPLIKTPEEIQDFLINALATVLQTTDDKINPQEPLDDYGLDSLDATTVMAELSDRCGKSFDFYVLWDYPTITEVADYIATELKDNA
ncbi:MAG: acyl carrier protein [Chloroflexota bacterium]